MATSVRTPTAEHRYAELWLDPDVRDCSEPACELFGCRPEALLGRSLIELSAEVQPCGRRATEVLAGLLDEAAADGSVAFRWRVRTGQGVERDIDARLSPAPSGGYRLRAEAPPARVGELCPGELRQILDTTSSIIAVRDLRGRFLFVNDGFERLLGASRNTLVGRTDAAAVDGDMLAWVRAHDEDAAGGGEVTFERDLPGADGSTELETRKFALRDPRGEPYAVCTVATDVSGRRRTDEALRKIALGVSAATGPEVFEMIVTSLADSLGVDFAFIARRPEAGDDTLSTMAACFGASPSGQFHYGIAGTPCERVLGEGFQYYSGNAQNAFPADSMLAKFGFESYAGYPLTDSSGAPVGVLSICHSGLLPRRGLVESILHIYSVRAAAEVERASVERARHAADAAYRTMFEASEDCVFVHEPETGCILDVNPRGCEKWGRTRDELIAAEVDILASDERPYTRHDLMQHIRSARAGRPVVVEWRRRGADGSVHWDEIYLKRVTLNGRDRVLAFTRDITERKEREVALARSEERLRATVQTALDCIIAIDAEGRVVEFNPAAEACFGHRREDVIGRAMADMVIPKRYRQAHTNGLARHVRHGHGPFVGRRVELTALRADGTEFPVELAVSAARGPDGAIFIGYLRDITERREAEKARERLEAELRRAQRMETIGQLTSGIAHDFNNLLTGISGYLALATDRAEVLGDPEIVRHLERARRSGDTAARLIRQMRMYSRGQRGRPRPYDPVAHLDDARERLRAALPATVDLHVQTASGVPATYADPVQIGQVMFNLCVNARDAMAGRGRIDIDIGHVELEQTLCSSCHRTIDGEFVELSVTDTGGGVDPGTVDRIFDPFFTTKGTGKGSGMGLAMVHGIVHEYGGHVAVDNAALGARFRIWLPVADRGVPGNRPAREAGGGDERRASLHGRVLLVDDDPDVLELTSELLSGWGLEVAAFASPERALAAFADPARDLHAAVVDHAMPGLSGLEVTARLREVRPDLPVLIFTGYSDEIDEAELERLSIRALLDKPADLDTLYEELRASLPAYHTP